MKLNKTVTFNILISLVLLCVIFMFQQYYCLCGHDYFWTYYEKGSSFFDFYTHFDRKFPSILCYIIINFLPEVLNIHSQDFVAGIGGEGLKAVLFFLVCCSAAVGFYISSNKYQKEMFFEKINFLILPISVFLFLLPNAYFFSSEYKSCFIIKETIVYTEYFVCLLFYFYFFISCLYVIFKEGKINTKLKIFIILNSFLIGCWNELYNVSVFFSILIFAGTMALFYKKLLKKDLLFLFIIPFFIGLSYFYLSSQYVSGTTVAFRSFHWNEIIQNINFQNFINEYVKYMFLNTIYFYLIIFLLVGFLIKCRNEKINLIIITCLSIVLGYLITNFIFIIFSEIDQGLLFARDSHQCIYFYILSFVIIMLTGCIYYNNAKTKKYLVYLFILIFLCIAFVYYNWNKIAQEVMLEKRILTYRVEKICLIYSLFGESAILPKSYLNNRVDEIIGGEKDKFYEESVYYTYARHEYNTDFCGYIFKDDEYAFSELRKRLNILNETFETDEELRNNKVSFQRLNKYKGFIFKLEDIEKIKETNENSDILLKAKAYINYKNDNLKEAENLYNKYLEKHNWDYDSLIKLNDIYLKLNKPKELNELYTKMFMSGKREMIFLRKWLFLNYYVIEDYDTAFKINQYIIDLVKENNQDWYVNKAIILLKLNKKEEAEKLFKHIKEDLKDGEYFIQNFITENNISSFEDIYKQSKLQLLKVNEKEHHEA